MASLPVLLNLLDKLDRETYSGSDFGLGLHPQHIHHRSSHHPLLHREPLSYAMPLSLVSRLGELQPGRRGDKNMGDGKIAAVGKDGFQVCMDVQQFKPSELTVKVVDNHVIVEGKHEEQEDDHGFISRHFVRRYSLPKEYDAEKVVSTLSSDGVLTVSVPKPAIEDKSAVRVVHIQQTGPAHLNVKENTPHEKQGKVEDGAADNGGDSTAKK